jgi:hypothetical protein
LKRREKTVWEVDTRGSTIRLKEGATVRRAAAFYADSEHNLTVFKYNSVYEVRYRRSTAVNKRVLVAYFN